MKQHISYKKFTSLWPYQNSSLTYENYSRQFRKLDILIFHDFLHAEDQPN